MLVSLFISFDEEDEEATWETWEEGKTTGYIKSQ